MDSSTRIKVLTRLALSNTAAADEAIARAFEQAASSLTEVQEYDALEYSLEVMMTVGFRHSDKAASVIDSFMRSIEARGLIHVDHDGVSAASMSRYRNAPRLLSKSIEVLSSLRYLQTSDVVESLLWASAHAEESVRKAATTALGSLAGYNISVYYGDEAEARRGIGATPQLVVIGALEGKRDDELRTRLQGVLTLLEGLLSTSMESASWSSSAVTLTRGVTPADRGVLEVRQRSIALLKRLYRLVEIKSQRLSIIRALTAAARAESAGFADPAYAAMISSNAQEVLGFFADVARDADLQIVQKIEHNSYWIHYHSASEEVRSSALNVKAIIDANEEYSIYKTLVGFEGVFGDWSKSKRDESFELGSQESRTKLARAIAARVPHDGFDVWRCRILTFAGTESNDLATFPVFYEFLAEVANSQPDFAMSLLIQDAERLSRFLIPILRGVWDSAKRDDLLPLMKGWVQRAEPDHTTFLYACAKLFLSTKQVDVGFLQLLLDKAIELADPFVMRQIAAVAAARSAEHVPRIELKDLFLAALRRLTELGDANWAREVWFRKEAKALVAGLSPDERREVLNNLRFLTQIDYEAEDVLAAIAVSEPRDVVEFLCERLYEPDERVEAIAAKAGVEYERTPFELHSLRDALSRDPAMVVETVLARYRADSSLFVYRGAKLLQTIFPEFTDTLKEALIQLTRRGGELELEFVSGVLRAYNGESFILPVAKEVIKRLPPGADLANQVSIALQSTGVVTGEYGMAEAYEQKRLEVIDWLQDSDERVRRFAGDYISRLEAMSERERARAEESIALRRFNYGED